MAATKKSENTAAEKKPKSDPVPKPAGQISEIKAEAPIEKTIKAGAEKVLFVVSEAAPYIRTGGLGDVAGALPRALVESGKDVRVVIPYYADISLDFRQTMKFVGCTYVPLSWRNQYCGIYEQTYNGVRYYFVDNEYYFKRSGIYGHFDDAERFAFFSKAVLEMLLIVGFYPDVIHCNDWHTALVPLFLDVFYRHLKEFSKIRTVFTIHNIEFQGKYDLFVAADILGIPKNKLSLIEYAGATNFMKAGIECADAVTTVSRSYAAELLDPYYAYGLESILNSRSYKLSGVLNGIDTVRYDPAKDRALFANYSASDLSGKAVNKQNMCNLINMHYDPERPMISMITRLTAQKGVDLVAAVIEELLAADIQLVILGMGDWKYETMFKELETRYGAKLKVIINFSPDLASKLYAASDIFLMPSKFEPCGLSQMIAMRYGTVPAVRETGGLKDTVQPYDFATGKGTGFTFLTYNAHDMLSAIWRAVDTFYNKKEDWAKIIKNGMSGSFGWSKSAGEYAALYDNITKK